jgi:glycosyltransferase involved in cell wall biosynthesis
MPKVSIITCTYNRAYLIGETIQSIIDQTCPDFEYIIVDDGSTDNTEEVIRAFNDDRIKYYKLPHSNGKLSLLRNFAHSKSEGEYIAYIDSDDLWEKEKLKLQVAALDHDISIGFSFTDVEIFDSRGTVRKNIYNKSGTFSGSVFPDMLANKLIICHPALLFRKSCIDQIGAMDETMHSGDHDFVMYLSRHFNAFVIYSSLVRVRKHDQNSTSSDTLTLKLMQEHHHTLKKLADQKLMSRKEYNKAYAIASYAFGVQLTQIKKYKEATYYFGETIKYKPWRWKAWIRILSTYLKK